MKHQFLAVVAATSIGFCATASASVFTNGSFEAGLTEVGAFTTLSAGDTTSIQGWTVGGAGIDYIGSYWQPENGSRSIDLNAVDTGSISQTFDVVNGQTYKVAFYMAGNTAGDPTVKSLSALGAGAATVVFPTSFDTTGNKLESMGWILKSFDFTASGSTETLTFQSTITGAYGPALDNVSVTPVPEASTWAMMLLGFMGVGFLACRRRARATFRFA
jgi:choice-of-anchor C domain-containing protein